MKQNQIDIMCVESRRRVLQVQKKLPKLFQLAEIDNSRDGKIGMEIGSARERIIIALFIHWYGEGNVQTNIPITKKEVDVIVLGKPISIKSITGKKPSGVKLIWTVDAAQALSFTKNYEPDVDMILAHINWGENGGLYYIEKKVQKNVLTRLGKNFFKLPKAGTNPRGVEMSNEAMQACVNDPLTKKIEIFWERDEELKYNPYKRWIDLWKDEYL